MTKQAPTKKAEDQVNSALSKLKSALRRNGKNSPGNALKPEASEGVDRPVRERLPAIKNGKSRSAEAKKHQRDPWESKKTQTQITTERDHQALKNRHLRGSTNRDKSSGTGHTKKLQPELTQKKIDAWLRRFRKDRRSPAIQAHFAARTAEWWGGQKPNSEYVMRDW